MSEENESLAVPAAVENERSEAQAQETTAKVTSPDDNHEAEAPPPDDKSEAGATGEGDDGDDDERSDEDRPKKPSRSERLRRQNERLKAEIETLKSGSAVSAVEDKGALEAYVAQKVGPAPQESDFPNDWFAYERAMTAYEADRRIVTRQVREQVDQAKGAQAERLRDLADDYQDNLKVAAKAVPDLMDVLTKATITVNRNVEVLILEAGDKAPLVAYHLAQNPKTAARLNAMSPVEAAREIGRIEARMSLPKPKTTTSASAPLSSLKGSAAPQSASRDLDAWLAKTYRKSG